MTTTDTDALTERIARALDPLIWTDEDGDPDATRRLARRHNRMTERSASLARAAAVLPEVAEEVRKAKSDALREAARDMGEWADEALVVTGDEHDESTWLEWTVGEWLEHRATEHETGDSDDHR